MGPRLLHESYVYNIMAVMGNYGFSEWNYICVDLRQINAIHQSWTTWEPYNHTYKLMPSIKAGQHGSLTTIPFQRCLFE
ncbi:hypothetical protein ACOSQ3_005383 [Xanthoceras sorbifolium]